MAYFLWDYVVLVSDHDENFNLLESGPIILDYLPEKRSYFSLPNISHYCLPKSYPKRATIERNNKELIFPPSYHIRSFSIKGEKLYLCCLRFDQLIYRKSGNSIWNSIREKDNVLIQSTHVHYALCLVSHYPLFSYSRIILSYILQLYIHLPRIPHSPFQISSPLSSPLYFPKIKQHLSLFSLLDILLNMKGLPLECMGCLHLPDISFPIIPSNSVLLPGMADLVLKATLSSFSTDMLLEIIKYLFTDGRVVIVSSDISLLSLAVEGIKSLLFPFEWKAPLVFIPILLLEQIQVINSVPSFLVGVPRGFLTSSTLSIQTSSFLYVDIDNQTIQHPFSSSLKSLSFPEALVEQLKLNMNLVIPSIPTVKDRLAKATAYYQEEVEKWRSMKISEVFDFEGNGSPFVLSDLPDFPEYDCEDISVNEWIDCARCYLLEFFFDYFGQYDQFLHNSQFDRNAYLQSRNRDWLLYYIIQGKVFASHLAELCEGGSLNRVMKAKRQYLATHNHFELFELCKRSTVLNESVSTDCRHCIREVSCTVRVPRLHKDSIRFTDVNQLPPVYLLEEVS